MQTASLSTRSQIRDEHWSSSDYELESRAWDLDEEGKFVQAEALFSQLVATHPHSARALQDHIYSLNNLGHYGMAITEGRDAVSLNPEDARSQEYLGISLLNAGLFAEAVPPLERSMNLDSSEKSTPLWLGHAYLKVGRGQDANHLFMSLMGSNKEDERIAAMNGIANIYYTVGDFGSAVGWWSHAAALGDKNGAQWLSWAYAEGAGVPKDSGDSAYWSHRANHDFDWFPRLPFADRFLTFGHGWGLICLILLMALLLPLLTVGLICICFGRLLTKDPSVHWTERARRSYPFQIYFAICSILIPLVIAAGSEYFPGSRLPISKTFLFWIVMAIGFVSGQAVITYWEGKFRAEPPTIHQNLLGFFVTVFIYGSFFLPFILMGCVLPNDWNLQAGLTVIATLLAYLWIQFGGWVRLGRLLCILIPAKPSLNEDAAVAARLSGRPSPKVFMMRWRKANAMALPFCNTVVVTEKARSILSQDELRSVLAHEIAHLHEDKFTRLIRLCTPLLIMPLLLMAYWFPMAGWTGFAGCYGILIFGIILVRKRARRMEQRADTFGKAAECESGDYSHALAKLYQANLVPAVMPGKWKVHPHLYDRLLAAGITPDYPRPKPAGRWGGLAGLASVALTIVSISAIWLSLF